MSEKAKVISREPSNISKADAYQCCGCGLNFAVNMLGLGKPRFCPYCGAEFETERTPSEIAEEIKKLYHEEKDSVISNLYCNSNCSPGINLGQLRVEYGINNEDKMEKLLDELVELKNNE